VKVYEKTTRIGRGYARKGAEALRKEERAFLGLAFICRVASYEAERFDVPAGVFLLLSLLFCAFA